MADTIKDSFIESNRFTKVVLQRGRDILDFELNEFQDILFVFLLRQMFNGIQNSPGQALNPGSNDTGWKVVGTGASNQVTIQSGFLFADGIPISNASSFTFSGFTTPGSNRVDTVYLAITEVEVTDPAQLPQLGETSRRNQLQITVSVSTTGPSGVPTNTPSEIWQGGTHYFIIANIQRFSGVAAINSGDVTDARFLLPPSLIAQTTRQFGFQIQALVSSTLETGDGTIAPKSANQFFDVDLDSTYFGSTRGWTWELSRDDLAHYRAAMQLLEVPSAQAPGFYQPAGASRTNYNGLLLLDKGVIYGSSGVLGFFDELTATNTGQPAVPLSDDADLNGGPTTLRLLEKPLSTTTPPGSLLRFINGRWHVTIGDGVNSFGDFSSSAALVSVFAYATSVGITDITIDVKPGSYLMNLSVSWTGGNIVIRGTERDACIFTLSSSLVSPSITATNADFVVENLTFSSLGFNITALSFVGGNNQYNNSFQVKRCVFKGCNLLTRDHSYFICEDSVFSPNGISLPQPCVEILSHGDAPVSIELGVPVIGESLFSRCLFWCRSSNSPAIKLLASFSSAPLTRVKPIVVKDTDFYLGSTTLSGGSLNTNCGVFDFEPNGTHVGSSTGLVADGIRFYNCNVRANSFGDANHPYVSSYGTQSILLQLTANTGNGNSLATETGILSELTIEGGVWTCPNVNTGINPFTFASTDLSHFSFNKTVVNIKNVVMGFDSSVRQGSPASEITSVYNSSASSAAEWGAFAITISGSGGNINIENWTINGLGDASNSGDLFITVGGSLNINGIKLTGPGALGGGGTEPHQRVRLASGTLSYGRIKGLVVSNPGGTSSSDNPCVRLDSVTSGVLTCEDWNLTLDYPTFVVNGISLSMPSVTTYTWKNISFKRCYISTCFHGFYVSDSSGATADISNITFDDCVFTDNSGNGFTLNLSSRSNFRAFKFKSCLFDTNSNYGIIMSSPIFGYSLGILLSSGPAGDGHMFIGNVFTNNNGNGNAVQIKLENNSNGSALGVNPDFLFYNNVLGSSSTGYGQLEVVRDNLGGTPQALNTPDDFSGLTPTHSRGIETSNDTPSSSSLNYTSGKQMFNNSGILTTP